VLGSYYFSHYTKLLQPTTRLITTEIMASCGATVPTSMNRELAEKYEVSQREVMRLREDIARHREEDAVTIANMTTTKKPAL
jgi:hypothetical protein